MLWLKQRLRHLHQSLRRPELWQKNRLLTLLYPVAKLAAKILGKVIAFRRWLRFRFNKTEMGKIIHRQRSIYVHLARLMANFGRWRLAKNFYVKALASKKTKGDSELRNEARLNVSVLERIIGHEAYKQEITGYNQARKSKPPKIAIYSAVSGGYDSLKLPAKLSPRFDYIFYTDQPAHGSGIYQIKPLPFFHADNTRQTRYVKTHPHQLLADYDIAIWIDANIMIMDDISPLIDQFIESGRPIAAIPHPLRKSVYEEVKACITHSKEDQELLATQEQHYHDLGYDCDDLIESNIMMFKLGDERMSQFFTTWWAEIDQFTRRDQLSLNYAINKTGIKWHQLMERPQNARNHPLFTLVSHNLKFKPVTALETVMGSPAIDPYEGKPFSKVKDQIMASQSDRRVDVLYCVYNALPDVKLCLESVVKNRHSQSVNLIIINDGSDAETSQFLQGFADGKSWVKLIRNSQPSGYTRAANQALEASTGELNILLNSDTIVTDGWIEKMAAAVFSTPGGGIVGPLSSAASHQSIPEHLSSQDQTAVNSLPRGLTAEDMNRHCEDWSVAGLYPLVPLVHGFCFGVTREVIDKVGMFDAENFPRGYGEENDYCFRAIDAGFNLVLATNTYIFHAKSKSYQSDQRQQLMKAGNQRLAELRTKDRVRRAIITMQKQPTLVRLRQLAAKLYSA